MAAEGPRPTNVNEPTRTNGSGYRPCAKRVRMSSPPKQQLVTTSGPPSTLSSRQSAPEGPRGQVQVLVGPVVTPRGRDGPSPESEHRTRRRWGCEPPAHDAAISRGGLSAVTV